MTITKTVLKKDLLKSHALIFTPQKGFEHLALLTHGYTSHKGSVLAWAHRLYESNVAVVLFDLPGHYIGSYHEVDSFEQFTSSAHGLFEQAAQIFSSSKIKHFILAGHSLGGLLALKAMNTAYFADVEKTAICVGVGDSPEGELHLFETKLYKSMMDLRSSLVSPCLAPERVFPWIKKEKMNLSLPGKKVHLITGKDDLVSPPSGVASFVQRLEAGGCDVCLNAPAKLAHHHPELAAGLIKAYLKKNHLLGD